jgi:hypothetical protein
MTKTTQWLYLLKNSTIPLTTCAYAGGVQFAEHSEVILHRNALKSVRCGYAKSLRNR